MKQEQQVRIPYRWRWPMPVIASLMMVGCGWLWLAPLRSALEWGEVLPIAVGVFLIAMGVLFAAVFAHFHFRPNSILLQSTSVEIPRREFTRGVTTIMNAEIRNLEVKRLPQKGAVLLILANPCNAMIRQDHLPFRMKISELKDEIARRAEIATGRKLD